MLTTSLPAQIWLLNQGNNYDGCSDNQYFSATELLKPIQQIVLSKKEAVTPSLDTNKLFHTAFGSAIHSAIESAWLQNLVPAFKELGVKESVASRIKINPESVGQDDIPVYLEQRVIKEVDGFKVGGKYDFIFDGQLYDIKTASTRSWKYGTNEEDYRKQGSIYKWLNQDKVTSDTVKICYIFKDWNQASSQQEGYPSKPVMEKELELMSVKETEFWIKNRLKLIKDNLEVPISLIQRCTNDELWMEPDTYKYYTKAGQKRATKVFTDSVQAYRFLQDQGKGYINKSSGQPKRCQWCPVFHLCEQKNEYFSR